MSLIQHGTSVHTSFSGAGRLQKSQRPFTSSSPLAPLCQNKTYMQASSAASSVSVESAAPAFIKQLLARAVDLVSNSRTRSNQELHKPCPVSYAEASSTFRPMSATARMAFAALEQDDEQEQQVALGALCLVTYSDSDDESSSTTAQSSRAVRAFAALNALQDSSACGTISEDDAELAVGVMETLCIVSYSEDDE